MVCCDDTHSQALPDGRQDAPATSGAPAITVCGGCGSECAFRAVLLPNGTVDALLPVEGHPCRAERLCNRGVRRLGMPFKSRGRIEHPLRRRPDGTFEEIGWDVAYREIAERILSICSEHGPSSLACTTGIASTAFFYAERLMWALGSPNVYGAEGACDISRHTGWQHTLGYSPECDIAHAEYIVYLGRSPLESANATMGDLVREALERGCTVVSVDPRLNPSGEQSTRWLRIRPGRDLAFLLGIANVLVTENLYDSEFVARYTSGFDEFAEGIAPYTPEWTESECDIAADDVREVARGLAAVRPRGVIDCGFHGGLGVAYANCVQSARMIALVNALLGNYGREGGNLNPPTHIPLGELDPGRFPSPARPPFPKVGLDRYPLVDETEGLCTTLAESVRLGEIRGLIAYASNPAMGYGNARDWCDVLGELDLLVSIDVRMSETARLADYVLPDVSFLECDRGVGVRGSGLYYRNPAIHQLLPDARPGSRIFRELAQACGVGRYFSFTDEELSLARVAPYASRGVDLATLRARGFVDTGLPLPPRTGEPLITVPSGRIEFASDLWERAGLGRVPGWIAPLVNPDPADPTAFRLISGNNSFDSHTSAELFSTGDASDPALLGLVSVLVNRDRAQALGIADGDVVEVYSELGVDRAIARVTASVHPEALFTSASPGGRSGKNARNHVASEGAHGVGPLDHTPLQFDRLTGAALSQENVVHLRKAPAGTGEGTGAGTSAGTSEGSR